MAKKRHSAEQIIGKLREVEVLVGRGGALGEAIRAIGVTEQTYYRWRKEYGGLKVDQAKRLKELERENMRLRKAVADQTLDKQILSGVVTGNAWSARRRRAIEHVRSRFAISERRACWLLRQHRSSQRKVPGAADDAATLTAEVVELAKRCGRNGQGTCGPTTSSRTAPMTGAGSAS